MKPALHEALQAPAWQTGAPLATAGQVLPQVPQFRGSLAVSAHAEPHIVSGAQSTPHFPEVHVAVTVPAVASSPESPERVARPALGATDVAEVRFGTRAAEKSFLELLDASLGL
jgi:hypothetical protein